MNPIFREKAQVLAALGNTTVDEHALLRAGALNDKEYWTKQPDSEKAIFKKFKQEVKDYYLFSQGRKCCYCSFELANDHSTFDAEHILDKSTHQHFMFELNNLAAACRPCNRAKNAKPVLAASNAYTSVPVDSLDYTLVHPHLDDWDDHLKYDSLNRIRPANHSSKGKCTIDICNIHTLNSARLSDKFGRNRSSAEKLLRKFFDYKSKKKKMACLTLLRELAEQYALSSAVAIVDALEQELA
jgi:uncharacterized protein (TIGR02646 family)